MEKVSIIVPVYNKADCVGRCIESVLAQTWQDWTLLLIDDGSKDNSLSICREYASKDPRIQVIAKENGGVSTARNAGLEVATGEYIVFLDSDDWWAPELLSALLDMGQKHPTDVLPMCGYYQSSTTDVPVLFDTAPQTVLGIDGIYQVYQRHYLNMLWNKLFLGNIIRDKQIRFREGIHWGEDKLFILEYLRNIRGYCILNRPLYYYDLSDSGLGYCFKADELALNEMLHREMYAFIDSLPVKSEAGQQMLWHEYMRVQLQGAIRMIKKAKNPRYSAYLKQDTLLRSTMESLHSLGQCSGWLLFCQKHAPLLLLFSYALKKKLSRS